MSELSKRQLARLRKRLRAEVDRKTAEFGKAERIEPPTKEWAALLAMRDPKAFAEEAIKEYLAGGDVSVSCLFERNPEWRAMKREADERIADLAKKRNDCEAELMESVERIIDLVIFRGDAAEAILAIEEFRDNVKLNH